MSTIRTELVTPAVTLSPVTVAVDSAKKLTKGERTIATAFAHWANVADQADDATLLLAIHLIHAESVSARRASEIATEVLGSGRGWSKDKVTAVRATAPIWEFAVSPARPADDVVTDEDGARVSVDALISRVRYIASVIGLTRVRDAIAEVDVPSVSAYIQFLEDALLRGKAGDPAPAEPTVEDEQVEVEVEPKSTTDADRIQAILNILSGIEGDDTLAGAIPALLDAVTAVALQAQPVDATV